MFLYWLAWLGIVTSNAGILSHSYSFMASQFDGPKDMDSERAMESTLSLIQQLYPEEYYHSNISHHFFIRTSHPRLQEQIAEFTWGTEVRRLIRSQIPFPIQIIPDTFDEIYLMRPEVDFVDNNKAHYDGILKLPGIYTFRSLTYLAGSSATFVGISSHRNFTTDAKSTILLDFNREKHYAIVDPPSNTTLASLPTSPRVMIKATVHVFHRDAHPALIRLHIMAHRLVFFGIKSLRIAFESSESNLLMVLDNIMRSLNNHHGAFPILLVGIPVVVALVILIGCPLQVLPSMAYIAWICFYDISPTMRGVGLSLSVAVGMAGVKTLSSRSIRPILAQLLLLFICRYMETNATMARHILLAPIPPAMEAHKPL